MPLPPATVQIKRKRTEDSPDLLHVRNDYNGLQGSRVYAYKRHRISNAISNNYGSNSPDVDASSSQQHSFTGQTPNRPPEIKATKPGDELRDPFLRGLTHSVTEAAASVTNAFSTPTLTSGHSQGQNSSAKIRRFHLARGATPSTAQASGDGRSKKVDALFIERRRPRSAEKLRENASHVTAISEVKAQPTSQSTSPNAIHVSGHDMPRGGDPEEMDVAMQACTNADAGQNISQGDAGVEERLPVAFVPRSVSSRFKPKTPVKRYHERHPMDIITAHQIEVQAAEKDEVMADDVESVEDEADYIIDTFVRVPVEMLGMQTSLQNIGLLVLDSQPDVDEFYNDDSDDDSEIYDEEEDENAENHPSTDYPDEEVDSDDEYGRDPYLYRNRNASDDEEFDEDDATYSDDDDIVGTTKAWSRQPVWMRSAVGGDNDED
ncbi:MAG: hypothetical protein M1818_003742 [Claussenomyces sp. TS43310]|nr:MAG: hypothetical protein M1818_003742 [Claussenomyces sp. TS43310]